MDGKSDPKVDAMMGGIADAVIRRNASKIQRALSETDMVHRFLLESGRQFRDVIVLRRNTGAIRLEDRFFHAGIPGQADVYAIARGGGHYELEFKSLKGKLNPAQERWRDRCRELCIPWALMQPMKGELPGDTLGRWLREVREWWSWS